MHIIAALLVFTLVLALLDKTGITELSTWTILSPLWFPGFIALAVVLIAAWHAWTQEDKD